MFGNSSLALVHHDTGYLARVARALDHRRVAAVLFIALLLSLGTLFNTTLVDYFTPLEVGQAWLEHFTEVSIIAAALMLTYTLFDEALPRGQPLRLMVLCVILFAASAALMLLLYGYYGHGFGNLPPLLRLISDSLRWGLPAIFLAVLVDVQRRALEVDSQANAVELSRATLVQGEAEQQLALLQAQLEPHFLFNVLGNVRRLYRTQPQAGADAIASMMRCLRTALPQLRSNNGSLGEEIDLVRAYLELFQVRMGARLVFTIDVDAGLLGAEFPPMLLVTLVENAIKHGIEPAGGGRVGVHAERRRNVLHVSVEDDGAGFGAAGSSGTGLGLANVRRQLTARYRKDACLTLQQRETRGAVACIALPLRAGARA